MMMMLLLLVKEAYTYRNAVVHELVGVHKCSELME